MMEGLVTDAIMSHKLANVLGGGDRILRRRQSSRCIHCISTLVRLLTQTAGEESEGPWVG